MSNKHADYVGAAMEIMSKNAEIKQARDLASKRHQLAEAEFESVCQNHESSAEEVEKARLALISLYEQYVDACLALRTYSLSAGKKLNDMMKELKL